MRGVGGLRLQRGFYYPEDTQDVQYFKNHFLDRIFCEIPLHRIQKVDFEFLNNFSLLFSSLTT